MRQEVQVQLARDASGFVRRACPGCGREFKTHPSAADARAVQHRLASLLPLGNAHECDGAADLGCLYCGRRGPTEDFLTASQRAHLAALARGLANHVRFEQLAHVWRTLSLNPRPTFVAVVPPALPARMPQEPDDMRVLPLLCCGEEVKALWEWDGPLCCPRCGARHGGMRGREKVQLEPVPE